MEGEAIYFNANFAYSVLNDKYLGDNDDNTKLSHHSCHTVIRFSQGNIHTHNIILLTVSHDTYLLFIKWKWILHPHHPHFQYAEEEEEKEGLALLP